MGALINIIVFLVLLSVGYFFGSRNEKKHYNSILAREQTYRHVVTLPEKHLPESLQASQAKIQLVTGNAVVAMDYFKMIAAGLRNFLGGRMSSYETLLDRARREALLRMQEQADAMGAKLVFNVKYETSNIQQNQKGNKMGSIEVLVYGTAVIPQ